MKEKIKQYPHLYWGVTAFCVLAGCILFYMLLQHLDGVISGFKAAMHLLSPFIWGFVIAYLLLPMCRFFEYRMLSPLLKRITKREIPNGGAPRLIAIALSILVAMFAISSMFSFMLPTVYESIESILMNYNSYIDTLVELFSKMFEDDSALGGELEYIARDLFAQLAHWVQSTFMPELGSFLSDMTGFIMNITSGVYKIFKYVMNIFIGIVVSCYLLYNREGFAASFKKLLYAVFGIRRSEQIQRVFRHADDAFMGFISGKILDSLIIGIITFVCCSVLAMPYPAFVSIIIGVTNIIPVFGPFIGAVPCTIIILMVQPVKALIFVIMILIIQQVDGNIIGPKILGSKVGINGFWVMFAIVVCGGLMGVPGMIIGVPLFVLIIGGYNFLIKRALEKRGLASETALYVDMDHMDEETGVPVPKMQSQMTAGKHAPEPPEDSDQSGE